MLHDLYNLKNELGQHHIFFCYVGPISQNLLTDIMAMLEQKMSLEQASRATILRVFSVIVEKVQNIIHYADEETMPPILEHTQSEPTLRQGIIAIGYENQHYFVLSGNVVDNSKMPILRKKLTKIQAMDKVELKHYYLEKRRKEPKNGSKGAGLGFIEMARRASQPIEFDFRTLDEHSSFFSLKTVI